MLLASPIKESELLEMAPIISVTTKRKKRVADISSKPRLENLGHLQSGIMKVSPICC